MSKQLEKPFEFLRNKDGSEFFSETYRNWYKARAFVLDKLGDFAFTSGDGAHLHVVVTQDTPIMLSVVRQVALIAHYINYEEENDDENKRKRSVITIVSSKNENDIVAELGKGEYLCNLLDYCKHSVYGAATVNKDSYIDIEIEIVAEEPPQNKNDKNEIFVREDEVVSFCNSKFEDELYTIDTRKAVYASRMYDLGVEINNLPYDDIHSTERYSVALDVFQYMKLEEDLKPLVKNNWVQSRNQVKVLEALSNIFCSDCFESRAKAVKLFSEKEGISESEAWKKLNHELSKSEHARWVVEKLIMGYRPMSKNHQLEYESRFGDSRKQYVKKLKRPDNLKDLFHIDLCSFADLRRIDPDNMKYDSFLVLGIPEILKRINKDGK